MTSESIAVMFVIAGWAWMLYLDWLFALALALIMFGYGIRNHLESREFSNRLRSLEMRNP